MIEILIAILIPGIFTLAVDQHMIICHTGNGGFGMVEWCRPHLVLCNSGSMNITSLQAYRNADSELSECPSHQCHFDDIEIFNLNLDDVINTCEGASGTTKKCLLEDILLFSTRGEVLNISYTCIDIEVVTDSQESSSSSGIEHFTTYPTTRHVSSIITGSEPTLVSYDADPDRRYTLAIIVAIVTPFLVVIVIASVMQFTRSRDRQDIYLRKYTQHVPKLSVSQYHGNGTTDSESSYMSTSLSGYYNSSVYGSDFKTAVSVLNDPDYNRVNLQYKPVFQDPTYDHVAHQDQVDLEGNLADYHNGKVTEYSVNSTNNMAEVDHQVKPDLDGNITFYHNTGATKDTVNGTNNMAKVNHSKDHCDLEGNLTYYHNTGAIEDTVNGTNNMAEVHHQDQGDPENNLKYNRNRGGLTKDAVNNTNNMAEVDHHNQENNLTYTYYHGGLTKDAVNNTNDMAEVNNQDQVGMAAISLKSGQLEYGLGVVENSQANLQRETTYCHINEATEDTVNTTNDIAETYSQIAEVGNPTSGLPVNDIDLYTNVGGWNAQTHVAMASCGAADDDIIYMNTFNQSNSHLGQMIVNHDSDSDTVISDNTRYSDHTYFILEKTENK